MRPNEAEAVRRLWTRAGLTRPWNEAAKDVDFALRSPCATILVARASGAIVATAMVGHDGHRGAVYYVASDPDARGQGLGRAIMDAAEAWLREQGVWKLNLLIRAENDAVRGFYEALGYAAQDRIAMQKDIS
jgi:ribosomal protein S18 acetylase RimI-like enzyme